MSSRVVDARSENAPKLTSQPANVAQRNRVPEETDARTVITSFDIVMGTAKVEEHGSAARSNDSPSFTALEWLTQQRANPAEVDKPIRNLEVAAKVRIIF